MDRNKLRLSGKAAAVTGRATSILFAPEGAKALLAAGLLDQSRFSTVKQPDDASFVSPQLQTDLGAIRHVANHHRLPERGDQNLQSYYRAILKQGDTLI